MSSFPASELAGVRQVSSQKNGILLDGSCSRNRRAVVGRWEDRFADQSIT
jgi:hypothetical protein